MKWLEFEEGFEQFNKKPSFPDQLMQLCISRSLFILQLFRIISSDFQTQPPILS